MQITNGVECFRNQVVLGQGQREKLIPTTPNDNDCFHSSVDNLLVATSLELRNVQILRVSTEFDDPIAVTNTQELFTSADTGTVTQLKITQPEDTSHHSLSGQTMVSTNQTFIQF